ncbi:hypothetical protein AAG570_001163 [Ranatra chinensis]|uniref:tRNA (guanine-N(7)-)-methyltransferase non-catalytic subunit wuho n=1 Tax=Ranatra chinensis TaxID=642074 RepID=A0ABD0YPX1_9HEMI
MASLATSPHFLALTANCTTVVYDFNTKLAKKLIVQDGCPNEGSGIVCSSFSDCGRYFVVCYKKVLRVFGVRDWGLVIEKNLLKAASQVTFIPGGEGIVIADKTGDVYSYSTDVGGSEKLLLGHLSLVLDVLVTRDKKYIITCDRDEKIRISCYPNAYNIHGYCLGHEEFVSSIHLLPHNPKYLVSCSGDGTIRIWDYCELIEVLKYDCSRDADIPDNGSQPPAITHMTVFELTSNSSILVVLVANFNGALVYLITSEGQDIKCAFKQIIKTHNTPWNLINSSGKLWFIVRDFKKYLISYEWSDSLGFVLSQDSEAIVLQWSTMDIAQQMDYIFRSSENQIGQLYKRKFDNVKEYLDKKRARLETKATTTI